MQDYMIKQKWGTENPSSNPTQCLKSRPTREPLVGNWKGWTQSSELKINLSEKINLRQNNLCHCFFFSGVTHLGVVGSAWLWDNFCSFIWFTCFTSMRRWEDLSYAKLVKFWWVIASHLKNYFLNMHIKCFFVHFTGFFTNFPNKTSFWESPSPDQWKSLWPPLNRESPQKTPLRIWVPSTGMVWVPHITSKDD